MSALPRESAFLPTIKCSSCGQQIAISLMGEHVCGSAGSDPSPPLDSFDSFMPFDASALNKIGRQPPPLDTAAANGTYMKPGQLTPVSMSSGSRSVSPKTPSGRTGASKAEDYFAPKIASNSPPPPRHGDGFGGFGDPDEYSDASSNSPKKQESSFMSRMDAISPGPFELGRNPSAKNALAPAPISPAFPPEGFGDASSNDDGRTGYGAFGRAALSPGGNSMPRSMPSRNKGYEGFGAPRLSRPENEFRPESFGASRQNSFPRQNEKQQAHARSPSVPGYGLDKTRRPSHSATGRLDVDGPSRAPSSPLRDTSRAPPPRRELISPSIASGNRPSVNIDEEFFGAKNPYHTSSDSIASSRSSRVSQPGRASSRSSSSRPLRTRRQPSDTSSIDNLMSDIQSSMEGFSLPKDLPPSPLSEPPYTKPFQQPARLGASVTSPLESSPSGQNVPTYRPYRGAKTERSASPVRPRPRDPPAPKSRGICRGCDQSITGKSVSSADGRLSGRYHKACFKCTNRQCGDDFPDGTFYVIDDRPYCKKHYHQLNGSLCGSCGEGIEGQYVEDEASQKYHENCFCCKDCRRPLADGYFEVEGSAYCERDAWRRVQQPWMNGRGNTKSPQARQNSAFPSQSPRPGQPTGLGRGRMGMPMGNRPGPPGPKPKMEKRRTRFGMM